jgi:hypothetical protein
MVMCAPSVKESVAVVRETAMLTWTAFYKIREPRFVQLAISVPAVIMWQQDAPRMLTDTVQN